MASRHTGADALATLATRFPQLYVAPAEGAESAHARASRQGIAPPDANLDHFVTSAADELREVDTPAGPVEVLFLERREDFETFLRIVGHKAQPVPIARTVGAITYSGLADWGKVRTARQDYLDRGGQDWNAEFARLARQPGAFRAQLVVISEGPYSNIDASQTPFSEDEWIRVSREIRLHHECAHVVCRRTMPDVVAPIWDEVTADTCGLICATGRYDDVLAARFLGVSREGFVGGRLDEYLNEDQLDHIDEVAREVADALSRIEELSRPVDSQHAFDFLLELKRQPFLVY